MVALVERVVLTGPRRATGEGGLVLVLSDCDCEDEGGLEVDVDLDGDVDIDGVDEVRDVETVLLSLLSLLLSLVVALPLLPLSKSLLPLSLLCTDVSEREGLAWVGARRSLKSKAVVGVAVGVMEMAVVVVV